MSTSFISDPSWLKNGPTQIELDFINAAKDGQLDVLRTISKNVLGHHQSYLGHEAMLYAAYYNQNAVVEYFVTTYGADVHYRNEAVLRCAARKKNQALVNFLLRKGANIHEALRIAAVAGHLMTVRFLFEHGADRNDLVLVHSVLQSAAENGHFDITRYLFEHHGANQINLPLRIWM